jgi:hypothetical protein
MTIPAALAELDRWVVWRYVANPGSKPRKVPFQTNGEPASHSNPEHWASYAEAIETAEEDGYNGVGFVFVAEDDICGVDIDGCRVDGKFTPEAAEILSKLGSYCEVSPSGRGVKIFTRARLPLAKGRKGPIDSTQSIEVYTSNRFFTFTGEMVENSPLELRDASNELVAISNKYFKQSRRSARVAGLRPANAVERAEAYADTIDAAISGQDGHGRLLYFCCRILNGFDLTESELWPILDKYNARCEPPWSQRELEHKVSEAVKFGELDPRGYMYSDDDLEAEATTTAEFLDWYEVSEPDWMAKSIFPSHLIPTDGLIGEIIEWIETTNRKSQPVLAMSAALSVISLAISRKICDDDGTRANLYVVNLARTGEGKQAPQSGIRRLVELCGSEFEAMVGEEVTADRAIENDMMLNNGVKLYSWDEYGSALKGQTVNSAPWLHSINTILLKLWNKTDSSHSCKFLSDSSGPRIIRKPCVSFAGWSTPTMFWPTVTEAQLTDGFVARLLLFDVTDTKVPAKRRQDVDPPEHVIERLKYLFNYKGLEMGNLEALDDVRPYRIPRDEDAIRQIETLHQYAEDVEDNEAAQNVWKRAAEKAARLAIISAVSRAKSISDLRITVDDAAWAVNVAKWCTATLISKAIQNTGGSTKFERNSRAVLDLIRNAWKARKTLQHSQLRKQTRFISSREFDEVVEHLVESGDVEVFNVSTTGRPAKCYRPKSRATADACTAPAR